MGYFILWLSSMAAALLLVALGAVRGARLAKRWQAITSVCVAALPGLVVGVLGVVIGGVMMAYGIRHHWLGYSISWLVVFVAGAVALSLRALARAGEDSAPRARSWPPDKVALGLGAAVAVFAAMLFHMDAAVRMELVKLHAESMEQMRSAMPARVPDHRNAGLVYDQAFEAMGDYKSWREMDWMRKIEDPSLDAAAREVDDFLRDKRVALAFLRRASAMPDYYFETDYTRGPAMRIPSLIKWRAGANLLALSARNRAAGGDMKGALEDVTSIRRTAAHLSTSPVLISLMIGVAIDATATSALEHVLAAGEVRVEDLGGLPLELPAGPFHASSIRAWQAEEATIVAVLAGTEEWDLLAPHGKSDWSPGNFTHAVWRVFFLKNEIKVYRKWMRKYREITYLPLDQMWEKAKELESEFADGFGGVVASIALPRLSACYVAIAEVEAGRRLSLLALAAEAYRARNGSYPRELSALAPDYIEIVPVDPFSGEPLKMLAVEGGLVLYSVYRDGEDDGGKDTWEPGGDREGDLTFCLGSAYEERRLKPAREAERRRRSRKRRSPAKRDREDKKE